MHTKTKSYSRERSIRRISARKTSLRAYTYAICNTLIVFKRLEVPLRRMVSWVSERLRECGLSASPKGRARQKMHLFCKQTKHVDEKLWIIQTNFAGHFRNTKTNVSLHFQMLFVSPNRICIKIFRFTVRHANRPVRFDILVRTRKRPFSKFKNALLFTVTPIFFICIIAHRVARRPRSSGIILTLTDESRFANFTVWKMYI